LRGRVGGGGGLCGLEAGRVKKQLVGLAAAYRGKAELLPT
jgi:hypothetical protein